MKAIYMVTKHLTSRHHQATAYYAALDECDKDNKRSVKGGKYDTEPN